MADRDLNKVKVGLLTVSDSCFNGTATDRSGENLKHLVESGKLIKGTVVTKDILPDELDQIKAKLLHWSDHLKLDLILTTGGTGFSVRDVTPEATKAVIEKEALGMTVAMMKGSLDITPLAMLTRLVCGTRGRTLIINLPGSTKGSAECFQIASVGIPHAVDLLRGHKAGVEKTHAALQAEGIKAVDSHHSQVHYGHQIPNTSLLIQGTARSSSTTYTNSSALTQQHEFQTPHTFQPQAFTSSMRFHSTPPGKPVKNFTSEVSTSVALVTLQFWKSFLSLSETARILLINSILPTTALFFSSSSASTNTASSATTLTSTMNSGEAALKAARTSTFVPYTSAGSIDPRKLNFIPCVSQSASSSVKTSNKVANSYLLSNTESFTPLQGPTPSHSVNTIGSVSHTHVVRNPASNIQVVRPQVVNSLTAATSSVSLLGGKPSSQQPKPHAFLSSNHSSLIHGQQSNQPCDVDLGEDQSLNTAPFSLDVNTYCAVPWSTLTSCHHTTRTSSLGSASMNNTTNVCRQHSDNRSRVIENSLNHDTVSQGSMMMDLHTISTREIKPTSEPADDPIVQIFLPNHRHGQRDHEYPVSTTSSSSSHAKKRRLSNVMRKNRTRILNTLKSLNKIGGRRMPPATESSVNSDMPVSNIFCPGYRSKTDSNEEVDICVDIEEDQTDCLPSGHFGKSKEISNSWVCDEGKVGKEETDEFVSGGLATSKKMVPSGSKSPQEIGSSLSHTDHAADFSHSDWGQNVHTENEVSLANEKQEQDALITSEACNKLNPCNNDFMGKNSAERSSPDLSKWRKCPPPGASTIKSAKIHNLKQKGELLYVPVGRALKSFINEHPLIQGISLHKGKREIKKQLAQLCHQRDVSGRKTRWLRGKEILERNRFDDTFELTEEGKKELQEVEASRKRDQYVVNWYVWCPGHGNCKRKCGGFGKCLDNCKGMLHKQDRHNCSLMLNMKLFLSDLTTWRIHIIGSHIPPGLDITWMPHSSRSHKVSHIIGDQMSFSCSSKSKRKSSPKKGSPAKKNILLTGSSTSPIHVSAADSASCTSLNIATPSNTENAKLTCFKVPPSHNASEKSSMIPSKKRISKMLSTLKRRREERSAHKSQMQGFKDSSHVSYLKRDNVLDSTDSFVGFDNLFQPESEKKRNLDGTVKKGSDLPLETASHEIFGSSDCAHESISSIKNIFSDNLQLSSNTSNYQSDLLSLLASSLTHEKPSNSVSCEPSSEGCAVPSVGVMNYNPGFSTRITCNPIGNDKILFNRFGSASKFPSEFSCQREKFVTENILKFPSNEPSNDSATNSKEAQNKQLSNINSSDIYQFNVNTVSQTSSTETVWTSTRDDFEQPFLNANTLSEILFQANSGPQQQHSTGEIQDISMSLSSSMPCALKINQPFYMPGATDISTIQTLPLSVSNTTQLSSNPGIQGTADYTQAPSTNSMTFSTYVSSMSNLTAQEHCHLPSQFTSNTDLISVLQQLLAIQKPVSQQQATTISTTLPDNSLTPLQAVQDHAKNTPCLMSTPLFSSKTQSSVNYQEAQASSSLACDSHVHNVSPETSTSMMIQSSLNPSSYSNLSLVHSCPQMQSSLQAPENNVFPHYQREEGSNHSVSQSETLPTYQEAAAALAQQLDFDQHLKHQTF